MTRSNSALLSAIIGFSSILAGLPMSALTLKEVFPIAASVCLESSFSGGEDISKLLDAGFIRVEDASEMDILGVNVKYLQAEHDFAFTYPNYLFLSTWENSLKEVKLDAVVAVAVTPSMPISCRIQFVPSYQARSLVYLLDDVAKYLNLSERSSDTLSRVFSNGNSEVAVDYQGKHVGAPAGFEFARLHEMF